MSRAKKRIVISSLYLGTGQFEKDLVSFLVGALDGLVSRGAVFRVNVGVAKTCMWPKCTFVTSKAFGLLHDDSVQFLIHQTITQRHYLLCDHE